MPRRRFAAAAALSALASVLSLPAAHAEPGDGACHLVAVEDPEGTVNPADQMDGLLYVLLPDPLHEISAVHCSIEVDGVELVGLDATFLVAAWYGAWRITVPDATDHRVEVCTTITDAAGVRKDCNWLTELDVPPQVVSDAVDAVIRTVDDVLQPVTPLLCTALITLAPGVPHVADISGEGDVWLLPPPGWPIDSVQVVDCPPYYDYGPIVPLAPGTLLRVYYDVPNATARQ